MLRVQCLCHRKVSVKTTIKWTTLNKHRGGFCFMTVDQKRQNCKDMRDVLILHFGYKDFNKDSVGYIDNASTEEIHTLHKRLLSIVTGKVLRK